MYAIEKRFTFEAGHLLDKLKENHPCTTIHGHSFKLYVKLIVNELDPKIGFVIDFGDLKFIKEYIDKNIDHSLILTETQFTTFNNSTCFRKTFVLYGYNNSSSENMCHHFCHFIEKQLNDNHKDVFNRLNSIVIKLYETENNCAMYKKDYNN